MVIFVKIKSINEGFSSTKWLFLSTNEICINRKSCPKSGQPLSVEKNL